MKKAILLLFLVLSLFIVKQVDAAEILQTNGIGRYVTGPTLSKYQAKFEISSSLGIKSIRHTKYDSATWDKVVAFKQIYTNETYSGFAYNCPGYYMTRFYSDTKGTSLIGWIRAYVAQNDITVASGNKCTDITDTSKTLPDSSDIFNVTHANDLVVEPNKMILNSLEIDSENPVIRDTDIEDLVLYDGITDEGAVNLDKTCRSKAASTGLGYELRYNENTKSWQCVNVNDCMYDSGLWYCNAQNFNQKYEKDPNVTVVDSLAYRKILSCADGANSSCSSLNTEKAIVTYSRPSDYLEPYTYVEVTDVRPTDTTPTFNSDPTGQYNTHDPNVVPPTPIGDSCWLPDGTPNFGVEGCMWNCDDPYMQQYSYCSGSGQETPDPYSPDPYGGVGQIPNGEEAPPFGDDENGDGLTPDNNVADSSLNDCEIKEICDCIAELKPALEQIDSSVGGVGEKLAALNPLFEQIDSSVGEVGEKVAALNPVLSDIKNGIEDLGDSVNDMDSKLATTNSRLSTINNSINGVGDEVAGLKPILDQIAENTSKNSPGGFSIESNEDADLNELPDISNVLDENRPTEDVDRQDRYTFDKKVFEDQGDDTEGDYGKLAPIPEPKHWKGLLPDEAMPAQKELTKDTQMQRTKENEKDAVMQQSPQLQVDSMQKSPQLKVDAMQKSPEMQKQQLEQDEQYTRNHFYNQTNTNLGGDS